MKRFSALLLASAFSIGIASAAFAAAADDVKAAYDTWNAAFNSGDASGIAKTYAEDAVLLPPTHDVIVGPQNIEAFFSGVLKSGVTNHRFELIKVLEDGDEIVAAAKWMAKAKNSAGADTDASGIATHVFQKEDDGSLKLLLHTFN